MVVVCVDIPNPSRRNRVPCFRIYCSSMMLTTVVALLLVAAASGLDSVGVDPLSERKRYTMQQHADNPYPPCKQTRFIIPT